MIVTSDRVELIQAASLWGGGSPPQPPPLYTGLQSLCKANKNDDNPCVKLIKDDDNLCVKLIKDDDNPCVKLIKGDDRHLLKPLKCDKFDDLYITFIEI